MPFSSSLRMVYHTLDIAGFPTQSTNELAPPLLYVMQASQKAQVKGSTAD